VNEMGSYKSGVKGWFHLREQSQNMATATITTTAGTVALPSIVVAGLPGWAKIKYAKVNLKYRLARDTSGSDNAINHATMVVQIDADGGFASPITAIDVVDNSISVDVSTSADGPGDVILGDNDVSGELTGNATYAFRFNNADADGNNLVLHDVGLVLDIWFEL